MDQNIKLIQDYSLQHINADNFDNIALSVFRYQYNKSTIYREFTDALGIEVESVKEITQIPYLPVSFFKTHKILSNGFGEAAFIFESSGTTGDTPARHYLADNKLYEASLLAGFKEFYGNPQEYVIIALLPSYLERKNASLVHMARILMDTSGKDACGFYLNFITFILNI